jgi:hypothetical protein
VLGVVEYALRLAFFAVVPALVMLLDQLVPMTAALVNIGLALGVFFFGEVLRRHASRRSWLGTLLRRHLAFEAFYREHPPKPFVYYLAYPLLFPYWLWVKRAREEFLLFKGYTLATLSLLAVGGVYRLVFVYAPELGPKHFVAPFVIGFVIESAAVLTLIMPMTTSVVALHRCGQRRRLVALLAVGLVSAAASGVLLGLRHRAYPSLETRYRVGHRSLVNKQQAEHTMTAALQVAWKKRREGAWGREDDGLLTGPALDAARKALERFYRGDEAGAFELWTSARSDRLQIIVLYAEGPKRGGRGKPVFLAMRADGTVVRRMADVPKEARRMMRTVDDLGRWDEL